MADKKIRVLVADDSALMRRTLIKMLEKDPAFEVIGYARDGEDAVTKTREMKPDVLSLDINMPKLDGLSVLQIVNEEKICPVVMISSLTHTGASTTFEALELGAFDYIAKPDGTVSSNLDRVADEIISKFKAAAGVGAMRRISRRRTASRPRPAPGAPVEPPRLTPHPKRKHVGKLKHGFKAIAIGISTGGPSTIMDVLPLLPRDINAAIFLVQHMPAKFTTTFARRLENSCEITVVEAESMMRVEPGTCYLAQGGYHLTLFEKDVGHLIVRTPSIPEHMFMPSVNVMMDAVLKSFGADTIGVLMTGIGDDGAAAMVKIREAGGHTIAESEETAVVFGMPREAIEMGGADVVAPSYKVAEEILKAL